MKNNRFSNRALALLTALLLLCQQVPAIAAAEGWNEVVSDSTGTADYVSVRFVADGEEVASLAVQVGAALGALPDAPKKEGFGFTGWVAGEVPVTEETVVTGEMEVNASYTNEAYPALSADYANSQIAVHIEAPEGALPKGITPVLETVSEERVREAVEKAMGHEVGEIAAVDISFLDENGTKVQPEQPVRVHISLTGMQADRVSVVHVPDELVVPETKGRSSRKLMSATPGAAPTAEVVVSNVAGNELSFDADSFSVYAVIGGTEPTARMQVNFHVISYNGDQEVDTTIATAYVKKTDSEDDLIMILYDPGVGELGAKETFRGWTFNKNYDVEEATTFFNGNLTTPYGAMSIEDVRDWAKSKQSSINENPMPVYDLYAMVLKNYIVNYLDRFEVSLNTDSAYMLRNETTANYIINQNYETNDEDYHFKGWITETENQITNPNPAPSNVTVKVETQPATEPPTYENKTYKLYTNNTTITLSGDITFKAHAPKGKWLVFDEVEKGATYIAPQFLEENELPVMPHEEDMYLLGYDFAGWYREKNYTTQYNGTAINEKTTVYAKWVPTTWAPYTVIIWKENLDGSYSYSESIQLYGPVGDSVQSLNSLSIVTFNSADYLQINGQDKNHNAVTKNYKTIHQSSGSSPNIVHHYYYDGTTTDSEYVGFYCDSIDYTDKNDAGETVPVVIDAPGTKTVNVYYKRITYTVRTYYIRRVNNSYYYATYRRNEARNRPELEINNGDNGMRWANSFTYNADNFPSNMQWEQRGDEYYSYVDITAKYGDDISEKWPKYADFENLGNAKFTSWYTMNSAGFYQGTGSGKDSFKGIITIMDEQILGDITSASPATNYLIGRYDNNVATYTYEIWRETADGTDYSSYDDDHLVTIGSKTYYHDDSEDIFSRSSAPPSGAHAPSYRGFEYDKDMDDRPDDPPNNGHYGNHYTLKFYYNRIANPIIFRDGAYFDGDGNRLNGYSNRSADDPTDPIPFESDVSSYNKGGANYNSTYTPAYPGFVLEGWYTDASCTTEFNFEKMPDSSITVYAKWRQVQYRVFLHPMVPEGKTVYWGSDKQEMNFRISWGNKASLPEGKLVDPNDNDVLDESYEFAGWYRDPDYTRPYDADAFVLNDGITVPYDKNADLTDEMDKYGEIVDGTGPEGNGWNSDQIYKDKDTGEWIPRDRWWITKKLDLYGKWVKKLEAGTGIQVLYDPNGGSNEVKDDTLYKDGTHAVAQSAPLTPPTVTVNGETKNKVFLYWVLQKWDESKGKFVDIKPMKFVYPGDDFAISFDNAHTVVTETTNPDTGVTTTKTEYFVQLRAEYTDPERETPTHIWWYSNFGENTVIKVNDTDKAQNVEDVKINEGVFIKPENTFTRPGYQFLGWARVESTENQGQPIADHPKLHPELGEGNLFLKYVEATDTVAAHFEAQNDAGEWVTVTQVAADEKYEYHDLYAVWKQLYAPVTLQKLVNGNMANVNEEFSFTVRVTESDGTTKVVIEGVTDNDGYVYSNPPTNTSTVFKLKHGQDAVTLGQFPIGSKLIITESGASDYKTDYTTTGTAPTFPITANNKTATVEVTELATGQTAIEVIFGNYQNQTIETGLTTDTAPYTLALTAGLLSAAVWLLLKRREKAAKRED